MIRCLGSEKLPSGLSSPVVAMGNFDGVHIGHRELIRRAKERSLQMKAACLVYTFDPHPARLLAPKHPPQLLQTLEQRLLTLESLDVDACVIEPFTHDFSHMSPDDFFNGILMARLHASAIAIGYDFTFGLHREGTVGMLQGLGVRHGIEVLRIEAQFIDDTLISSTNIRRMLTDGDIKMANALLGRPYSIEGTVISGRGLGGALNAHTANIETSNELIPKNGVYITMALVGNDRKAYPSVTSIGDNPTFPDSAFAIETHVLDMSMDLIGKNLEIQFLKRTRDQVAFRSQDDLKDRIQMDISEAREFHKAR